VALINHAFMWIVFMNNMRAKRAKRSNLLVSSFLDTLHDDNDSCCDTDEYDLDKYEVELANSPGSVHQLTECQTVSLRMQRLNL